MTTLVACPCCARHIRPTEPSCPFCGLTLEQAARGETGNTPWYAIAALSTTLVLSGCPQMMARYGAPPQPENPARIAQPSQRETMDIYGAPPPRLVEPQDVAPVAPQDPGGMAEAYGAPPPPNTGNRDR
jgi:hypothetical protein